MVFYSYRCESCRSIAREMHSMQSRPDVIACPACRASARRMIGSPHLGRTGTGMALQDATRATADRPSVVAAPPPVPSRNKVTTNPLHRSLPRP